MSKVKIKITPKGFTLRKTLPINKFKKFYVSPNITSAKGAKGTKGINIGSAIIFDEFERKMNDIELRLAKPILFEYFFFFLVIFLLINAIFIPQPLWILPIHFLNAKFHIYDFVRKYIRYKKMVYEHKLKALKE